VIEAIAIAVLIVGYVVLVLMAWDGANSE